MNSSINHLENYSENSSMTCPRILLVRLSALGDVIQTLPVVWAIKKKHPKAFIVWVTDQDFAEYLRAVPEIDEVIAVSRKGWFAMLINPFQWKQLWKEVKEFRQKVESHNLDLGIDLQGLMKSALLLFLTGLKRRIGFNHWREATGLFYTERYINRQEYFDENIYHIQHMFSLLEPLDCEKFDQENVCFALPSLDPSIHSKVELMLSKSKSSSVNQLITHSKSQAIVGIILGTQWESKIWPKEDWEELTKRILKETNCSVLLLGGKADLLKSKELLKQVEKELPEASTRILNLSGQTNFFELQALLSKIQIVVGADTAPIHLAGAVGTPLVISLFGPTACKRTAPLGVSTIKTLSSQLGLSCMPCHQRFCKLEDTNLCMKSISPQRVLEEIKTFSISDKD